MKSNLIVLASIIVFGVWGLAISCNKGTQAPAGRPIFPAALSASQLAAVESYLKDSMPNASYDSLDFKDIVTSITDSGDGYFVRVPSLGISIGNRFVLIKTNDEYVPLEGACIEIARDSLSKMAVPATLAFYGTIRKTYLNGTVQYLSAVNGGYIQVLHSIKKVAPMDEVIYE